jgi:hypothetical protein
MSVKEMEQWDIDFSKIQLGSKIGQGSFGCVWQALYLGVSLCAFGVRFRSDCNKERTFAQNRFFVLGLDATQQKTMRMKQRC